MRGLVIKSTGSSYIVRLDDGSDVECRIKGNFRIRGIRSTNPVAVGDFVNVQRDKVQWTKEKEPSVAWITDVLPRRNYIIRKATNLSKESHILAANIDQVALLVTVNHPATSTTFIDRFLATCEAYRVRAILIFNKTDILDENERHYQEAMVRLYQTVGYECRQVSAATGEGIDELRPLLQGKVALLSGNSGVGKSTLINQLVPGAHLRTAEISDAHNTGMHTTTFSEMIANPRLANRHAGHQRFRHD